MHYKIVDEFNIVNTTINKSFKRINQILNCSKEDKSFYDVIIVNNKQMQAINLRYRKINRPTDVISFALRDAKTSIKTNLLGEIYINYEYVNKNNFHNDICLLFIHGLLHLLGYDHNNKINEHEMFSLQKKVFEQL